ncbi:MAG: creatininase family protein [bacterium]
MTLKSVWLQDNTWQDAEAYLKEKNIVIFPIGATEQHGPTSALGLDTYNAIHIAEDVAKRKQVLVTPPLWFGDSSHHTGFPGTISLRSETVVAVVKDILRSLLQHGFKKIIIINGHKVSNLPALTIAAKDIHEYEYQDSSIAIADPWKIARGIAGELKGETVEHHAGVLEVSQLLYKRPDLVDVSKLSNASVNPTKFFSPWGVYDLFGKPLDPHGNTIDIVWNSKEQRKAVPTGQFSDNTKTSKETGEKYHNYMIDVLSDFIDWFQQHTIPEV